MWKNCESSFVRSDKIEIRSIGGEVHSWIHVTLRSSFYLQMQLAGEEGGLRPNFVHLHSTGTHYDGPLVGSPRSTEHLVATPHRRQYNRCLFTNFHFHTHQSVFDHRIEVCWDWCRSVATMKLKTSVKRVRNRSQLDSCSLLEISRFRKISSILWYVAVKCVSPSKDLQKQDNHAILKVASTKFCVSSISRWTTARRLPCG